MNTNRQAAIIVGVLFIMATVSAILARLLYGPVLNADYLSNGAAHKDQVALGVIMELILVGAAIGTTVGLFPFVRRYNERIAIGYLCFRFLEAVLITMGAVAVLALLTLSQTFVAAGAQDTAAFQVSGTLLQAVHTWTFILGPLLMLGVNTLMYTYLLYKSRLVPRVIATLGLTAATLVLIDAVLVILGVFTEISPLGVLLAMPIAVYEMILAVWLIAKGFNAAAIPARSAQTATNELLSAA